jgi:predicted regulator of Ras-like GTPase activity (Roadblock/LC7/MglB family)
VSAAFGAPIAAVVRLRGVLACMVVDEADGIVVASELHVGIDADVLAAVAAALFRGLRRSAEAAALSSVTYLQLEAERGFLCAAGHDGLVLVALAEPRAQMGLVRAAMMGAAEQLA